MARIATQHDTALMPTWMKRVLIAISALLMCSCRADGQSVIFEPAPCPACESPACQSGDCFTQGCEGSCQTGILGPKDEYLCDGNDAFSPAAVLNDGSIVGLEQEDTIGTYRTRDGKLIVVPSSRVCIYAPRFGAVRKVIHPMGAVKREFVAGVGDSRSIREAAENQPARFAMHKATLVEQAADTPPGLFRSRQQAGAAEQLDAVAETRGLVGPYANLQLVHVGLLVEAESATVAKRSIAAIMWAGDQSPQIMLEGRGASAIFSTQQAGVIYETNEPNSPRLRVVKLASTDSAHVGDEVDFTLRVDNVGDTPIYDVTIIDNLTTRLAYVEDSQKSSIETEFAAERNDRGSLVLRWQITEPIQPGEGGILTFKTRVR